MDTLVNHLLFIYVIPRIFSRCFLSSMYSYTTLCYMTVLHLCHTSPSSLTINRKLLQPTAVNVTDYGHTYITISWHPAVLDSFNSDHAFIDRTDIHTITVLYQIWHWPVNASLELVMSTTFTTSFTISNLLPGQAYSLWVLGIADNITSDYVTLLQTTGIPMNGNEQMEAMTITFVM